MKYKLNTQAVEGVTEVLDALITLVVASDLKMTQGAYDRLSDERKQWFIAVQEETRDE